MGTVEPKYSIGDLVMVDPSERDPYEGEPFVNAILEVVGVYTSSAEHFGYDDAMNGMGLNSLVIADTREDVPCDLYDYELVPA